MKRTTILGLILVLAPALAIAQDPPADPDKDKDKVSNDQPGRPIQMPPALGETREAFDDFERFSRRGAWERATKALYTISEAQAGRFVDGKNGFVIPVSAKRREVLAKMSPEGIAAYRLFYDTDAKKLLDQAEGATEQATLERLYSAYFLTSVGDNAADRLGDLYFEQGRFDRAADCWLAVLRDRTDTDLTPARLAVKAAVALARAGRTRDVAAVTREFGDRLGGETVTIAGRKAKVSDFFRDAADEATRSAKALAEADAGGDGGPAPRLQNPVTSTWQLRFADSVTAGMTPLEAQQWDRNRAAGAVPVVAVEGDRLYANYFGHVFAVDLTNGKMLWRSSSFHNIDVTANGGGNYLDISQYAVVAAPGYVWTLGRDPKDSSFQSGSRLVCHRAENGEVVWQTSDLPEHAGISYQGKPIRARGMLFLAAKSTNSNSNNGMRFINGFSVNNDEGGGPRQLVVAIRPHDGKIVWKSEIGVLRSGSSMYEYYGSTESNPSPQLIYRAGSIYVETHAGILARLDAESGGVDWGYAYATAPTQQNSSRGIFIINGVIQGLDTNTYGGGPPLVSGDLLLTKGAKADRIAAIDPDGMSVAWDRPVGKAARLVGMDDRTLYLGGTDLSALDRETKVLKWSLPLPIGTGEGRAIIRPEGVWQLTARGIFEVDPASGNVRGIYRGDDPQAVGGDLILAGPSLLAITNRTITAYPRRVDLAAGPAAPASPTTATTTRGSDD